MKIRCSAGDFAFVGRLLAEASPARALTEDCRAQICAAYSIGKSRTPARDSLFLVDELVEIAARALSKGVNDPFTAMTCLDWLGAAAAGMARRDVCSDERRDSQGVVRVIRPTASFESLVERGFGRSRHYVGGDPNAASHALGTLALVARNCCSAAQVATLRREATGLMATAEALLEQPMLAGVHAARKHAEDIFGQKAAALAG